MLFNSELASRTTWSLFWLSSAVKGETLVKLMIKICYLQAWNSSYFSLNSDFVCPLKKIWKTVIQLTENSISPYSLWTSWSAWLKKIILPFFPPRIKYHACSDKLYIIIIILFFFFFLPLTNKLFHPCILTQLTHIVLHLWMYPAGLQQVQHLWCCVPNHPYWLGHGEWSVLCSLSCHRFRWPVIWSPFFLYM